MEKVSERSVAFWFLGWRAAQDAQRALKEGGIPIWKVSAFDRSGTAFACSETHEAAVLALLADRCGHRFSPRHPEFRGSPHHYRTHEIHM